MPDTDFSRTVVVNHVIDRVTKKVRALAYVVALASISLTLWAWAMGWETETAPEWVSTAAYALVASLVTLAVLRLVLSYVRHREGGSS